MLRKSIPYKWALSLNVPTLRKRNLHRNKGGQWKKKTENLLSWCQISNRCEILINFGLSYLFLGLFAEAGKCQDKETCNCHKQRFT